MNHNSQWIVRIKEELLPQYVASVRHFFFFIRQCLGNKKIVVISEKNISSMPVSFRIQAVMAIICLGLLLWLSYSTGRYFSYEKIISQKDREIWNTHVTNERLQYQVSDLHDNLKQLNRYFTNIQAYDQLASKDLDSDAAQKQLAIADSVGGDGQEYDRQNAQELLYAIRQKVMERVGNLERVIDLTGLKLKQISSKDKTLSNAINAASSLGSDHQGGPYIPFDESRMIADDVFFSTEGFNSEIDYLMNLEKVVHSLPLTLPMKRHYYLTSRFGRRIDPITRKPAMHAGLDLVGAYKSPVYAPAPGKVRLAGRHGAYGNFVEIDHGFGIRTRYGHLYEVSVKRGEVISRGDVVGLQGNTGRSTGTHLHYEVRYNGTPLNPENFIKAGRYVF